MDIKTYLLNERFLHSAVTDSCIAEPHVSNADCAKHPLPAEVFFWKNVVIDDVDELGRSSNFEALKIWRKRLPNI